MKRGRSSVALAILAFVVALVLLLVVVLAFIDYQQLPPVDQDTRTRTERVADSVRDALLDIFT